MKDYKLKQKEYIVKSLKGDCCFKVYLRVGEKKGSPADPCDDVRSNLLPKHERGHKKRRGPNMVRRRIVLRY